MENFQPLNQKERETIVKVQEALANIANIPCTDCQYCMKGCPQEIVIPRIFGAMNTYLIYNNLSGAKGNYSWETRNGGIASKCIECGQCEDACPQHIQIIDELKRAATLLEA
jgi:predicted aldo/keto reductase-like oxidoreductase